MTAIVLVHRERRPVNLLVELAIPGTSLNILDAVKERDADISTHIFRDIKRPPVVLLNGKVMVHNRDTTGSIEDDYVYDVYYASNDVEDAVEEDTSPDAEWQKVPGRHAALLYPEDRCRH